MPIAFACSKCGQKMRAQDGWEGKHVRCVKCSSVLTVPGQPAVSNAPAVPAVKPPAPPPAPAPRPVVPAVVQESPPDKDAPPLDPAWSRVRRGLSCHHVGYTILFIVSVLTLLGQVGILLALLAVEDGAWRHDLTTMAGFLPALTGAIGLPGAILVFVGDCLCCAVPRESRGKGLIVGRLLCILTGLLLTLAPTVLLVGVVFRYGHRVDRSVGYTLIALYLIGVLLLFVANILYLLFLRKVALFFGKGKLARRVVRFFVFWLGLIAVLILSLGVIGLVPALMPREYAEGVVLLLFFGWATAAAIGIVLMFLKLLGLIRGARNVIRDADAERYLEMRGAEDLARKDSGEPRSRAGGRQVREDHA